MFSKWYWWKTPCVTVWHNRLTILIFCLFEYLIFKKKLCDHQSELRGIKPMHKINLGVIVFLNDLKFQCWKILAIHVTPWRLVLVTTVFSQKIIENISYNSEIMFFESPIISQIRKTSYSPYSITYLLKKLVQKAAVLQKKRWKSLS